MKKEQYILVKTKITDSLGDSTGITMMLLYPEDIVQVFTGRKAAIEAFNKQEDSVRKVTGDEGQYYDEDAMVFTGDLESGGMWLKYEKEEEA